MARMPPRQPYDQLVRRLNEARRNCDELLVGVSDRERKESLLAELKELEFLAREAAGELREAREDSILGQRLSTLGELVGGVAHELRNPLGTMETAIHFLNARLPKNDPEAQEILDILQREVTTSERIVSGLLACARPNSTVHGRLDIGEIVGETVSRARVPKNIVVIKEISQPLPPVRADRHQLIQAFGNIISNAVAAMPKGGQLIISVVPDSDGVSASFSDSGAGISEENMDKLFKPFFTAKQGGTGLGLVVTRILVHRHGGTIEVESQERKGSTFTVKIPSNGGETGSACAPTPI